MSLAKLIVLGAGHSNVPGKDRGAADNHLIEGELTVSLRNKIARELKWLGANYILDSNSNILRESINYFKKLTNKDAIVIDIHFNAGPSNVKGTESLIPNLHTDNEQKLAELLSKCTAETLNTKIRGIKGVKTEKDSHHSKLAWMSLKGENVVWEVEFITNKKAMEIYLEKEDLLAENIAHVLYAFSINHYMITQILNNERVHKVRIGDTLSKLALLYSTSVEEIKSKNNLSSDYIYVEQELKV